jgi:hypothetical protein
MAVRRVGGWCELAASLQGRMAGSTETSTLCPINLVINPKPTYSQPNLSQYFQKSMPAEIWTSYQEVCALRRVEEDPRTSVQRTAAAQSVGVPCLENSPYAITLPIQHPTSASKTYSKVHIGKHLSDNFPIQNGLKQGHALSPLLFNFAMEYVIGRSRKTRWNWN